MGERESFLDDPDGRSTLQPLALDSIYAIWFLQAFASWQDWATVCLCHPYHFTGRGISRLDWRPLPCTIWGLWRRRACLQVLFSAHLANRLTYLTREWLKLDVQKRRVTSGHYEVWTYCFCKVPRRSSFVLACSLARSSFLHRDFESVHCAVSWNQFFFL